MEDIQFRPLTEDNLLILAEWLSRDFVREWYSTSDSSYEGVRKKYLPRILGVTPISCFFIYKDEQAVGFIQTYWYSDYPSELIDSSALPTHTASLDIFLSDSSLSGKGLGKRCLVKFLETIIFGKLGAEACLVDPDPNNLRAIAAYRAVGFEPLKLEPRLYILNRSRFYGRKVLN